MNPNGQIGNGMVNSPGVYQTPDYTQIGFNKFLERQPSSYMANSQLDSMVSPFIGQIDEAGYLFNPFSDMNSINQSTVVSGQQVQNGVISSNDGSMNVDLIDGNINFSNGVQTTMVDANGISTTPTGTNNAPSGQ